MPSIDPAALGTALLSPLLVFVCVAIAWRGLGLARVPWRQDVLLVPWAFATAVAWHPGVLQGSLASRAGDSLFTLPPGARAALVAIALVAGLVPLALSVAKTRALRRAFERRASLLPAALDLVASVSLGLVSLALAPQLFYAYYRRLFPDLPSQWVVEGMPSSERLAALARPAAAGSLADHAAALFLWTLALACLLGWLLDVRQRRRPLRAAQAATAVAAPAALWSLGALALA